MRSNAWIDVFSSTAEDYRVLGGMEVESDDVAHLRNEVRVAAHLVSAHAMRLEPVAPQKVRDTAARQANLLGEQPRRPAAAAGGWGRHRQLDDPLDRRGGDSVIAPPPLGPRVQAGDATLDESPPYSRNRLHRQVQAPGNLDPCHTIGAPQNDMRAPHHLRRFSRVRHELLQVAPLLRRKLHHHPLPSHATFDEPSTY